MFEYLNQMSLYSGTKADRTQVTNHRSNFSGDINEVVR